MGVGNQLQLPTIAKIIVLRLNSRTSQPVRQSHINIDKPIKQSLLLLAAAQL